MIAATRKDLPYGLFANFEILCPARVGCRTALWSCCCSGGRGPRSSPNPALRQSAASVHFLLFRGHSHHFLVCRSRAGSARAHPFLFVAQRSLCSAQNPRFFFG